MRKLEEEKIMKYLTLIGAIILFIIAIVRLISFSAGGSAFSGIFAVIWLVLGIILILSAIKPGKPIPFKAIFLFIIGIIAMIIAMLAWIEWVALIGGIIVTIAGLLGYYWEK